MLNFNFISGNYFKKWNIQAVGFWWNSTWINYRIEVYCVILCLDVREPPSFDLYIYLFFVCSGFLRDFFLIFCSRSYRIQIYLKQFTGHLQRILLLWAQEDRGVMAMKGYSTFLESPKLERHYHRQFRVIFRISMGEEFYSSARDILAYSKPLDKVKNVSNDGLDIDLKQKLIY